MDCVNYGVVVAEGEGPYVGGVVDAVRSALAVPIPELGHKHIELRST